MCGIGGLLKLGQGGGAGCQLWEGIRSAGDGGRRNAREHVAETGKTARHGAACRKRLSFPTPPPSLPLREAAGCSRSRSCITGVTHEVESIVGGKTGLDASAARRKGGERSRRRAISRTSDFVREGAAR